MESCLASKTPPTEHISEMNEIVEEIVIAYNAANIPGADELYETYKQSKKPLSNKQFATQEGKQKQQEIDTAIKDFPTQLSLVVQADKGAIMLRIMEQATQEGRLTGMLGKNA